MESVFNTVVSFTTLLVRDGEDDDGPGLPPGTPGTQKYEGPWFSTQLILASSMGIFSFLTFSYMRKRWPVLYAPRTKLKGFSPHEAHAHQALFGWIMPTIKTSEYAILQIVGLDAAVMLNFFKMSFQLFLALTLFSVIVIMPVNFKINSGTLFPPDEDEGDNSTSYHWLLRADPPKKSPKDDPYDWLDLITDSNGIFSLQLLSTYLFTALTLRFIHENYKRFVRSRQLYTLELVHSIPARTVMMTNLPPQLRSEKSLAVWWEKMGLQVESVSLCREVGTLMKLLEKRTHALLELENNWVKYVGNPSTLEAYDPESTVVAPLVDFDVESGPPQRLVIPHASRPTYKPGILKAPVDAIEFWESEFNKADDLVRKRRKHGKFRASHVAFVTFEEMSSAQIAAQVLTAPYHSEAVTTLAPEPKDIVWSNMNYSIRSVRIREFLGLCFMFVVFFLWIPPVGSLATFLSYAELQRLFPWLIRWIDQSDRLRAIVQHSLPTIGVVLLNALLPFIVEFCAYFEGVRARSWIEYRLMKRYFLFLLINVVFIFLFVSSYWQVVRDLYEAPGKIPQKLATALRRGTARNYFVSYVILQALGIMPLQLLNLGVVVPRFLYIAFVTRTPRDFAELNAPPMINYGTVYPQSILVFVITLLYSINQPLVLIFGTLYFGAAYIVYKYKLLFVFYKPYESHGQAWPITFVRIIWGVLIFQTFMAGNFLLREKYWIFAVALVPLIAFTLWWGWYEHNAFNPPSQYVSLSSVCEVQKGADIEEFSQLRAGHPVTRSQSNLNRRRYAENDDTLYVAPEDERTDYSQPPMSNWYYGVLNCGKRRYGHPALTGVLPKPWLPLKKGQSLVNRGPHRARKDAGDNALVLTLRRRQSASKRRSQVTFERPQPQLELSMNPWNESTPLLNAASGDPVAKTSRTLSHRMSFDVASGVMALPEEDDWIENGADSDSEDYGLSEAPSPGPGSNGVSEQEAAGPETDADSSTMTPRKRLAIYFHHPEKRVSRPGMPGEFPR